MTPLDRDLDRALATMPKVELHVHLEGAQHPDTIWAMAKRNRVELPANSPEAWRAFYQFRDFAHFIEVYIAASRAMRTPQDFYEMTVAFHATQAEQRVLYTEAFLSASLLVEKLPWDELFAALEEGRRDGQRDTGGEVRFIPDIARNFPQSTHRVVDFTLAGFERGLFLGLGLGGLEAGHPPEPFADAFRVAREAGMRVVAHAGEGAGAESVRGAVEVLGAERIGHGIRCLEDRALVEMLVDRQLPIEVCPTSNYCTGVVARDARHPIFAMLDAGLNVSINSDDPPMFGTTLTDEFRWLASQGVPFARLEQCVLAAVEASFLDDAAKTALRSAVRAG
ncbi:MAG TPA: adenosine deaminase [Gemmatimonadales bacterium]|nr:adenosine deaminase [Gemmatimonadales bacterium]